MSDMPRWRPNSAAQRNEALCQRPKSVTSRSPVRSTAGRRRHGDRAVGWLRAPGPEIVKPHCMWQTSRSSCSGQPSGGMSQDLLPREAGSMVEAGSWIHLVCSAHMGTATSRSCGRTANVSSAEALATPTTVIAPPCWPCFPLGNIRHLPPSIASRTNMD
jgi:hypothetical protein